MEFKGTKGKWEADRDDVYVKNNEKLIVGNLICLAPGNEYPESNENWKYNSKLISKAPEMLEMLKKANNTLKDIYGCDTSEIEQLIKESTTI